LWTGLWGIGIPPSTERISISLVVNSIRKCNYVRVQHTVQHRTIPKMFLLILQTCITSQLLSIQGSVLTVGIDCCHVSLPLDVKREEGVPYKPTENTP